MKARLNGDAVDTTALCPTQREMVEAGGRLSHLLGLPRTVGQIFGLLYVSLDALSLDDLADLLGISKASASNGTRQLLGWGAIRQVWVPGNRRDHFEVVGDVAILVKSFFSEFLKPRIDVSRRKIDHMMEQLERDYAAGEVSREEYQLFHDRIRRLGVLQRKVKRMTPLAERML